MSRSYKKEPIYKDKGDTDYNKRLRRRCKQIEPDEDTVFPLSHEITNQYDICDYKMDARDWLVGKELKKFKRK
jgi:hypothetical protein